MKPASRKTCRTRRLHRPAVTDHARCCRNRCVWRRFLPETGASLRRLRNPRSPSRSTCASCLSHALGSRIPRPPAGCMQSLPPGTGPRGVVPHDRPGHWRDGQVRIPIARRANRGFRRWQVRLCHHERRQIGRPLQCGRGQGRPPDPLAPSRGGQGACLAAGLRIASSFCAGRQKPSVSKARRSTTTAC